MPSGKIIDLRRKKFRLFARQSSSLREPDKRTPLRARRRRARSLVFLIFLIVLAVIAYGLHWFSYRSQYEVNNIEVNGMRDIDPALIRQHVDGIIHDNSRHFLSSANIFLYPREVIEKRLAADFPRIKFATVSRPSLFSQTVVVHIEERALYALWCRSTLECYQMDDIGSLFAIASTSDSTQYIFAGGLPAQAGISTASSSPVGQTFVPAHFPGILAFLKILGQSGFLPQGAIVENESDFSVPLVEGFTIKASFGADAQVLVKNLQLILTSDALKDKQDQLEYVDLRFGNRVYYKLKGETQQTSAE